MRKNNQQDAIRFWKQKEKEIGEEIIGKEMCEYRSCSSNLEPRTWGLLYYTGSAFYFQTFPKKSFWSSLLGSGHNEHSEKVRQFKICWDSIKEIKLPPKKKSLLSVLLLSDYRVSIKYRQENNDKILTLLIYSRSAQEKILECFKKYQSEFQSVTG